MALPGRFWPKRRALSDEDEAALDVWAGSGAADDCSDAVFMTTRGGNQYDRTFMESFVRPGLDNRNWVSRANYPAQGVVPTGDTEMSIYVGRGMGQEAAWLERLTLRTDGFSSLHGGYGGGEMLTRHFWFGGSELLLNYSTSAAGNIRVEVHDESGAPIEGFTLDDCDPDHRRRRRPRRDVERQHGRERHRQAADQAALRPEGRRPVLAALPVGRAITAAHATKPGTARSCCGGSPPKRYIQGSESIWLAGRNCP